MGALDKRASGDASSDSVSGRLLAQHDYRRMLRREVFRNRPVLGLAVVGCSCIEARAVCSPPAPSEEVRISGISRM